MKKGSILVRYSGYIDGMKTILILFSRETLFYMNGDVNTQKGATLVIKPFPLTKIAGQPN